MQHVKSREYTIAGYYTIAGNFRYIMQIKGIILEIWNIISSNHDILFIIFHIHFFIPILSLLHNIVFFKLFTSMHTSAREFKIMVGLPLLEKKFDPEFATYEPGDFIPSYLYCVLIETLFRRPYYFVIENVVTRD